MGGKKLYYVGFSNFKGGGGLLYVFCTMVETYKPTAPIKQPKDLLQITIVHTLNFERLFIWTIYTHIHYNLEL